LYQVNVLPVLVYGSEVWTITEALARRLDASDTELYTWTPLRWGLPSPKPDFVAHAAGSWLRR